MFVSIWNAQLSESEIKYYLSIYLSLAAPAAPKIVCNDLRTPKKNDLTELVTWEIISLDTVVVTTMAARAVSFSKSFQVLTKHACSIGRIWYLRSSSQNPTTCAVVNDDLCTF